MSTDADIIKGPFILWMDYGCEGWQPTSFATLKEALEADKHSDAWLITKPVKYTVYEDKS